MENQAIKSTSTVIKGLAIYIITAIASTIMATIMVIANLGAIMSAAASGDADAIVASMGATVIISAAIGIISMYGLWVYYSGLKQFSLCLDEVGAKAAGNLATAALLMFIGALLNIAGLFLPVLGGIIYIILMIIAFIMNIMGYSALKNSSSFNELGKAGAKQLLTGFIFAIIAACCVIIPVIGWIASPVLSILYWIYLFQGWGKIKTSFMQ